MKETLRHQQAFEYYYMLGAERNFTKVANHFEVSNVSITKWAEEFNWRERVKERDFQNMEVVRKKNDADMREEMETYRKLIKATISGFIKDLKDQRVRIENINDFVKLVNLDMELSGVIEKLDNKNISDNDPGILFNISTGGDVDGDQS